MINAQKWVSFTKTYCGTPSNFDLHMLEILHTKSHILFKIWTTWPNFMPYQLIAKLCLKSIAKFIPLGKYQQLLNENLARLHVIIKTMILQNDIWSTYNCSKSAQIPGYFVINCNNKTQNDREASNYLKIPKSRKIGYMLHVTKLIVCHPKFLYVPTILKKSVLITAGHIKMRSIIKIT